MKAKIEQVKKTSSIAMATPSEHRQTADRRGVYACHLLDFLSSGVTEPKFTKFLYDVAGSSEMNLFKSEKQYCNLFRNVRAMNKGE